MGIVPERKDTPVNLNAPGLCLQTEFSEKGSRFFGIGIKEAAFFHLRLIRQQMTDNSKICIQFCSPLYHCRKFVVVFPHQDDFHTELEILRLNGFSGSANISASLNHMIGMPDSMTMARGAIICLTVY